MCLGRERTQRGVLAMLMHVGLVISFAIVGDRDTVNGLGAIGSLLGGGRS